MVLPIVDIETAIDRVFRYASDVLLLVFEYQDGIYGNLVSRFAERYDTIPRARYIYLNPTFRPLSIPSHEGILMTNMLVLSGNIRDFRFPFHLAIAEGELEIVKRIFKNFPHIMTSDAIRCAIKNKRNDIFDWLLHYQRPFQDEDEGASLMHYAVISCNFYAVTQLHNLGIPLFMLNERYLRMQELGEIIHYTYQYTSWQPGEASVVASFVCQDIQMLIVSIQTVTAIQNPLNCNAISRCTSLEMIQILLSHVDEKTHDRLLDAALRQKNYQFVSWLLERYEFFQSRSILSIIKSGHLKSFEKIIKFKQNNAIHYDLKEFFIVTDLSIAKLLCKEFELQVLLNAVPATLEIAELIQFYVKEFSIKHLKAIMSIVYDNTGCTWEMQEKQRVDVLKYVHHHCMKPPFDQDDLKKAINLASLPLVQYISHHLEWKYLIDIGYGCTNQVACVEIFKYLYEIQGHRFACDTLYKCINRDHINLVKYLVSHVKNYQWSQMNSCTCLDMYDPDMILYLINECDQFPRPSLIHAIGFHRLDILIYLSKRFSYSSQEIRDALVRALNYGAMPLLDFLWNIGVQLFQQDGSFIDICQLILLPHNPAITRYPEDCRQFRAKIYQILQHLEQN